MPNWCCFCQADGETSGHLFIHCSVAVKLWNYMLARFNVMWVQPLSLKSLFSCWCSQSLKNRSDIGVGAWKLILATICWSIWVECNGHIFEGVVCSFPKMVDSILSLLYDWLSILELRGFPPFWRWMFEWDSFII